MSTDNIPGDSDIEVVSRDGGTTDSLWGPVPPEQRLEWLRAAQAAWPFYPGAAVGGLTARTLAEGHLVNSASLIRVARNAFEAGFTPTEYKVLRGLIRGIAPDHLVLKRDERDGWGADFFEIDAHQWRGWLDLVRGGMPVTQALDRLFTEQGEVSEPSQAASECETHTPGAMPAGPAEPRPSRFGTARGSSGGWGIPFSSAADRTPERYPWFRVLEVFPPVKGPARTATGKYASQAEGDAWRDTLAKLVDDFSAAGFSAQDLYTLYLTLARLTDDDWARVDKRLFVGAGVHTREAWMLAPIPERWSEWPMLVHEKGLLPHEATDHILDGSGQRERRRWF